MAKTVKPQRLKRGDKVGIISPSGSVLSRKPHFEKAIDNFCSKFGLEPVIGDTTFGRHFFTSAPLDQRVNELHKMFIDPSIKAIVWTVGGSAAMGMIDKLDYELIKKNPKVFLGISDFTTLALPINKKTGLVVFHGIELGNFADLDMTYTSSSLRKTLFEKQYGEVPSNEKWKDFRDNPTRYDGRFSIREGSAEGVIVGGVCTPVSLLANTEYCPSFKGSILVLDFYKFAKKQIYAFLKNLHLKGLFSEINGLIIGHTVGGDTPEVEGNEMSLKDLVLEATEGYAFPIMQVGEIGHYVENFILPIGARASMDSGNLTFSIDEAVVE